MLSVLALMLAAAAAPPAVLPCPARPQPMPAALDSVPPVGDTAVVVAFAATAWEHPERAWVVRLSRRGYSGPASLEVLRLRRRSDCNVYDLENSWRAPMPAQEFEALARAAEPFAAPPPATFSDPGRAQAGEEVVLDGTGIELRLRAHSWDVRRRLNHYGRDGREISALFHRLVDRIVPAGLRPAQDWRRGAH